MNEGKRYPKNRIRNYRKVFISILLIVIMIIGVSYAWLQVTLYGEKELSIITAGSLLLELDDSMSGGINITSGMPLMDEDGKKLEGYIFTLENRGTIDSDYTLYLDDLELNIGQERLKDNYVKYYLTKDGGSRGIDLLSSIEEDGNRILDTGEISPGDKYTYVLRLWIDYDVPNEAMGKVFKGKLRVEAVQKKTGFNKPRMDSNMMAVVYDEKKGNWVKVEENDDNWYDYDAGKWANAVTVTSTSRNKYQSAESGIAILMDDIETMWVWIPRYSYTIGSEDGENYYGKKGQYLEKSPTQELPGEIDIKFISKSVKDKGSAQYKVVDGVSGYRTPAGFTFGNEELSGVWVGKFETSSSNPKEACGGGNDASLDAMIKPNVASWRGIQVSNAANVGRNITKNGNRYGFDTMMFDSHAMKSNEWALVSYLSQSKYGKLGNKNYIDSDKEIYINKSNEYITGCSYGTVNSEGKDWGCQYTYEKIPEGIGASTTGTIYGIYDMSGGSWEYMMGNYAPGGNKYSGADTLTNSGYTGLLQDGTTFTGRNWLEDKYYDFYTSSDSQTACNGKSCITYALNETEGWYQDLSYMAMEQYPWLVRGGYFGSGLGVGIFSRGRYSGDSHTDFSFRLVLVAR